VGKGPKRRPWAHGAALKASDFAGFFCLPACNWKKVWLKSCRVNQALCKRTRVAVVLGAGVHRGVVLQLGGELQLQPLQALLRQRPLHVLRELDLLGEAQDLHTRSKPLMIGRGLEMSQTMELLIIRTGEGRGTDA